MRREDVYAVVDEERDYQNAKWGKQQDIQFSAADWIIFMEDHLAKAKRGVYDLRTTQALAEVRKITALGVACLERFGAPSRYTCKEALIAQRDKPSSSGE